jgi:phosphonate transport system permease protein
MDARRVRPWAVGVALGAALLAWSLLDLGFFDAQRWARGAGNLVVFLGDLTPPTTEAGLLATLAGALVETLQMAYVGTVLGAALALPLAVLAARPLAPEGVRQGVRFVLAAVRTIPSLLWALLFVIMVGLGPLAGMLGIAAYTLGYLGKLFYEALEGVDPEVVEALRATGASRSQLARHAVLPEAANALVGQSLFVFEYNVRASSILGFVGAGGIGFYLLRYLQLLEYRSLATALLLLLATVLVIEAASDRLRRRVRVGG